MQEGHISRGGWPRLSQASARLLPLAAHCSLGGERRRVSHNINTNAAEKGPRSLTKATVATAVEFTRHFLRPSEFRLACRLN
jgi:hypothetical protein